MQKLLFEWTLSLVAFAKLQDYFSEKLEFYVNLAFDKIISNQFLLGLRHNLLNTTALPNSESPQSLDLHSRRSAAKISEKSAGL